MKFENIYRQLIEDYSGLCDVYRTKMNQCEPGSESHLVWRDLLWKFSRKLRRIERRFVKYHQRFTVEGFSKERATILDETTGLVFHVYYDLEVDGGPEYEDSFYIFASDPEYELGGVVDDPRILQLLESWLEDFDLGELYSDWYENRIGAAESLYDSMMDR